jgi:hypothetical protein
MATQRGREPLGTKVLRQREIRVKQDAFSSARGETLQITVGEPLFWTEMNEIFLMVTNGKK